MWPFTHKKYLHAPLRMLVCTQKCMALIKLSTVITKREDKKLLSALPLCQGHFIWALMKLE